MKKMNLLDMTEDDIKILQILKNNGEIRFIEFHSKADGRDHIINVDRFTEIFGYTVEELKEMK